MIMSELHRRIKYAVAKELVEVGYTAGVDVPISEGGFVDVQGRKGNDVLNIEVWKTQLPDWLIVRVKEATKASIGSETEIRILRFYTKTHTAKSLNSSCSKRYLMLLQAWIGMT